MSDIQGLIKLLQSKNPDKRYDACEQLRVSPSLPIEALEALRLVTNDSNPDVADAAQRALALHTQMDDEKEILGEKEKTNSSPNLSWLLIGLLVGVVPAFCLFSDEDFPGIICLPSFTASLSLIGAYIGKRRIVTAIIGAILGLSLGLGLLLYIVVVAQ